MASFTFFLVLHILAGTICLVTGILAATARKRRGKHTVCGEIYHYAYVVIFVTSIVMAVLRWNESAYLFYIALFSYSLALLGYLARKFTWKNWLLAHISGMLGSYIGIMTAVLVVNQANIPFVKHIPSLVVWLLPTVIGTPVIIALSNKSVPRKRRVS